MQLSRVSESFEGAWVRPWQLGEVDYAATLDVLYIGQGAQHWQQRWVALQGSYLYIAHRPFQEGDHYEKFRFLGGDFVLVEVVSSPRTPTTAQPSQVVYLHHPHCSLRLGFELSTCESVCVRVGLSLKTAGAVNCRCRRSGCSRRAVWWRCVRRTPLATWTPSCTLPTQSSWLLPLLQRCRSSCR